MDKPEQWDPIMLEEYLWSVHRTVSDRRVGEVRQRVVDRNGVVVGLTDRGTQVDVRKPDR